uniref:G-protein coupled receptors family 1 profile domain-containing protein n=1 Tax=Plectus sambesii TaxID=2011161 RepID=A0A914W861_9BILA
MTAFIIVLTLLTPVFEHSDVFKVPIQYNNISHQVMVLRKCGFSPPPPMAMAFNLYACFLGYLVPMGCFVYFYLSLLMFLKRHAQLATITGKTGQATVWRVGKVVFGLIVVYIGCWTPYWVAMWIAYVSDQLPYRLTLLLYFIHMLPYISCSAYPIIYTAMNRGIKDAHAKIMIRQRRRLRSLTDEAVLRIDAVRSSISGRPRASQDSTMVSTYFTHTSTSGGCGDKTHYMLCPNVDNREELSVELTAIDDRHDLTGWETLL